MANTTKGLAKIDAEQALKGAINLEDFSLTTSGFLTGKVGRKVDCTISTTTIPNDTETYAFSENGSPLYSLKIIYTTGDRDVLLSAERIS